MRHPILFYPHGGSGNHGCEAIVRATMRLLRPREGVLFTTRGEEDERYGLDRLVRLVPERTPIRRLSFGYATACARRYLLGQSDALDRLAFGGITRLAPRGSIALCSGGDNYCYREPLHIYLQNELLRRAGMPTILWGCSLEEERMKGAMLEDLRRFDLIVARESLTFDALRRCGIERAVLYPDPAFALTVGEPELPDGWRDGNMAGVNISPLILNHEARPGIVMENYARLVRRILAETDLNVALIPHVVWPGNDDRDTLAQLADRFQGTGRVVTVADAPCEALKGAIARCRFLVAARTHASIAAYSTGVPTLVAGYSVKARGIARDLFGEEDGHVLPVQTMNDPDALGDAFFRMMAREEELKRRYASALPAYRERLNRLPEELETISNRL